MLVVSQASEPYEVINGNATAPVLATIKHYGAAKSPTYSVCQGCPKKRFPITGPLFMLLSSSTPVPSNTSHGKPYQAIINLQPRGMNPWVNWFENPYSEMLFYLTMPIYAEPTHYPF